MVTDSVWVKGPRPKRLIARSLKVYSLPSTSLLHLKVFLTTADDISLHSGSSAVRRSTIYELNKISVLKFNNEYIKIISAEGGVEN